MKTYIFSFIFCLLAILGKAQNENTEIIVISGDDSLTKDDVEITIKRNGKKIKVDKENIKVIPQIQKSLSFNFDNFDSFDDDMTFNIESLKMRMRSLFDNIEGLNQMDGQNFQWNFKNEDNLNDFNELFDNLGNEGEESSDKLELGDGDHVYLFKSDDGRPIIEEEKKITIEKSNGDVTFNDNDFLNINSNPDERPLIFLNGKEYDGSLEDLKKENIYSVQVEKGTQVEKKFGERGKNGVMYIKTK